MPVLQQIIITMTSHETLLLSLRANTTPCTVVICGQISHWSPLESQHLEGRGSFFPCFHATFIILPCTQHSFIFYSFILYSRNICMFQYWVRLKTRILPWKDSETRGSVKNINWGMIPCGTCYDRGKPWVPWEEEREGLLKLRNSGKMSWERCW